MNSDDYFEYEGRLFPNPTKTRDETLSFVDSLRNTVGRDNQAIAAQTERLGTDISPNLGGLTGSEGYFTQRYQTAPIEYQVNTLKATAQADALNKLMTNYKNQAVNRYQQAYRNAARSAARNASSSGEVGDTLKGGVTFEDTDWVEDAEAIPPKEEDYWISGKEQTDRIVKRTGLPDWLVNILKIFGAQ